MFVPDVPGIQGRCRLEQKYVGLTLGGRTVFHAAGYDEELPLLQLDFTPTQPNGEPSFEDEEELVFVLMLVPHKLALELDELHQLAVQMPYDSGTPVIIEQPQLLL